mmetsp:Transcript_5943/g.13518  ORF Transcript_5943/g.13518 Transcript_5943/m.13518 type:complete len:303 (+) Transcript_5943:44-952(+)
MALRLMTMNTYLVPAWFTKNTSCKNQDTRAAGIGDLCVAENTDIVTLQEVWGSNTHLVQRPLENAGYFVLPGYSSWGHTILDTVAQRLGTKGGLWGAHKPSVQVLDQWKHQFSISETRSGKGALFVLYDASGIWGEHSRLLLTTTHLDPFSEKNQITQIKEIAEQLKRGVPRLIDQGLVRQAGDLAVVITGDTNIAGSDNHLYAAMLASLHNARDLHAEASEGELKCQDSHTYDDRNSLCEWRGGRLDYILATDSVPALQDGAPPVQLARVSGQNFRILRQPVGHELSDHWAVIGDLSFTPR